MKHYLFGGGDHLVPCCVPFDIHHPVLIHCVFICLF